jgi:hypothetical protein
MYFECLNLLGALCLGFKTLGVDLKLNSNSEVHKPFCPDGIKAHANFNTAVLEL